MTFLLLVATFIGFSCLVMPLVILAVFALFDRNDQAPPIRSEGAAGVTRPGG